MAEACKVLWHQALSTSSKAGLSRHRFFCSVVLMESTIHCARLQDKPIGYSLSSEVRKVLWRYRPIFSSISSMGVGLFHGCIHLQKASKRSASKPVGLIAFAPYSHWRITWSATSGRSNSKRTIGMVNKAALPAFRGGAGCSMSMLPPCTAAWQKCHKVCKPNRLPTWSCFISRNRNPSSPHGWFSFLNGLGHFERSSSGRSSGIWKRASLYVSHGGPATAAAIRPCPLKSSHSQAIWWQIGKVTIHCCVKR